MVILLVGCAEGDEHVDRIEACVLGKRPRDNLKGVCERLDGKLGAPADGCGIFTEPKREFDLGCPAAGDELFVLEGDADDPETVLDGTGEFVDDVFGATTDDDRDRLRVLAFGDEGHLFTRDLSLLDFPGLAEFLGGDGIDGADDRCTSGAGEFLHVALLDTPHGKDAGLGEIVLRDVVDALLAEEDVCTACNDLVDDALDHPLLFVEEHLELVRTCYADLCVDLGFLELDSSVQEQNLCVLDNAGHAGVHALFIDDHTLNDLGVLDGTTDLLLDLHKIGVDGAIGVCNHCDRPDNEIGEFILCGLGTLAGHGSIGDLFEHRHVIGFDVDGDLVEDLLCLVSCHAVAVGDNCRMHILVKEVLSTLQELACDNHCGCGAVTDFVILSLGDLDHHLCGGVFDIHLL